VNARSFQALLGFPQRIFPSCDGVASLLPSEEVAEPWRGNRRIIAAVPGPPNHFICHPSIAGVKDDNAYFFLRVKLPAIFPPFSTSATSLSTEVGNCCCPDLPTKSLSSELSHCPPQGGLAGSSHCIFHVRGGCCVPRAVRSPFEPPFSSTLMLRCNCHRPPTPRPAFSKAAPVFFPRRVVTGRRLRRRRAQKHGL